jgi:hypothetical protein
MKCLKRFHIINFKALADMFVMIPRLVFFIPRNVESHDKRALQVAVEAIVFQIQNS